jgi:hypothetical protein
MFGGWLALRTPALDFSGHTETCRLILQWQFKLTLP